MNTQQMKFTVGWAKTPGLSLEDLEKHGFKPEEEGDRNTWYCLGNIYIHPTSHALYLADKEFKRRYISTPTELEALLKEYQSR